jgi:NAD(P)-dependent dehydrogenase (short-subunit alcohol dehydrogenase family)
MGVNLRGYFNCAQAFGRSMLERGSGAIVHIASIAATEPHQYCIAYSPSKAAVVALSEQMTLEWGPRGVRSNCISPGLVRTPLAEEFYARPGVAEARREAVPLREIGAPEDIAQAALFLSSDLARYICGANLVVDGGLSLTAALRIPRPVLPDPGETQPRR